MSWVYLLIINRERVMELQSESEELYQAQMENRHSKDTISSLWENWKKSRSFMTYAYKNPDDCK
jgi:hypothetical protein